MTREITVVATVRVKVDLEAYGREYGEHNVVEREVRAFVKDFTEQSATEAFKPLDNVFTVEQNIY